MVTVGIAAVAAGAGAVLGLLLARRSGARSRSRLQGMIRELDDSLGETARRLESALERAQAGPPETAERMLDETLLEAAGADARRSPTRAL